MLSNMSGSFKPQPRYSWRRKQLHLFNKKFVEALPHKPEGRGFESLWGYWDFSFN
jgi:hypothetical protein